MSEPTTLTDPRLAFRAATTWVADLLSGVSKDQLDLPTPCPEFDVRTLAAHLNAVAARIAAIPEGIDIRTMPVLSESHDAETYAATIARALDRWSDDAILSATVQVPWGEVPGGGALWGYVHENVVHGWDLAVATGQEAEADPELAGAARAFATRFLSAEIRQDPNVPFGAVVEPRPDAGPTERLASWAGRDAASWAHKPNN